MLNVNVNVQKDLYAKLGVSEKASRAEIKKAFRQLSRTAHPDKGGKSEHMRDILEAYNTLVDPEKRERFDKGEKDFQSNPNYQEEAEGSEEAEDSPDESDTETETVISGALPSRQDALSKRFKKLYASFVLRYQNNPSLGVAPSVSSVGSADEKSKASGLHSEEEKRISFKSEAKEEVTSTQSKTFRGLELNSVPSQKLRPRQRLLTDQDKNAQTIRQLVREAIQLDVMTAEAVSQGDCFFDSVAQALEAKGIQVPGNPQSSGYKRIRVQCRKYMSELKKSDHNWIQEAMDEDAKRGANPDDYRTCLTQIEYTHEEIEAKQQEDVMYRKWSATWGRSPIEGRMISEIFHVKICVIDVLVPQKGQDAIQTIILSPSLIYPDRAPEQFNFQQMSDRLRTEIQDPKTLFIINYKGHFVPLLKKYSPELKEQKKEPNPAPVTVSSSSTKSVSQTAHPSSSSVASASVAPAAQRVPVASKSSDPSDNDVFDFIRYQTVHGSKNAIFSSPNSRLSPPLAIEIFHDFLKGLYYGKALADLRQYMSTEIQRIRKKNFWERDLLLYENIEAIFRIENMEEQESHLFTYLQKICEYAQDTSKDSFSLFISLFQSRHFRQLFSHALQAYWRSTSPVAELENRKAFDGEKALQKKIKGYTSQLTSCPKRSVKRKMILQDIQELEVSCYLETHLNSQEDAKQTAENCRDKAYYILDWISVATTRDAYQLRLNAFLQAGLYFQRAALIEQKPVLQMADETMAFVLYHHAMNECEALLPDATLYAFSRIVKYVSRFQFQREFDDMLPAMQRRVLKLIDIFPFILPLQSNSSYRDNSWKAEAFFKATLHALVDKLEGQSTQETQNQNGQKDQKDQRDSKESKDQKSQAKPFDHDVADVLYQAYEACLKNRYGGGEVEKQEEKFRQQLMKELLRIRHWTKNDLAQNLDYPWVMVGRDEKGWMIPSCSLPFPKNKLVEPFQALEGMEINHNTGDIHFLWKEWKRGDSPSAQLVTLFDLFEILKKNIFVAFFSLDPVDPNMPYHPFNQMRFGPNELMGTQFLHTLFLTDYLLKFFTTGQEVQGSSPYAMRSLETLTRHVPVYLMKIIHDFRQNSRPTGEAHRFWIEAEEAETANSTEEEVETKEVNQFALSPMKMVVRKHLLERNAEGELVDAAEAHEGWHHYVMTEAQRRAVQEKRRVIETPAMIFAEGTNDVYFWDDEEMSDVFHVRQIDHWFPHFFHQTRDEHERVVPTSKNRWRLYRITREIAKQAGQPHYFTAEYCFSQEFTAHYDEFAQYFPEFGRLRELSRMMILARYLNAIRAMNQVRREDLEGQLAYATQGKVSEKKRVIKGGKEKPLPHETYLTQYEKIYSQISPLLRVSAYSSIFQSAMTEVRENRRRMGNIVLSANSPEVVEACNKAYWDIHQRVLNEYPVSGQAMWSNSCNQIWSQIQTQVAQEVRTASATKKAAYRQQLDDLYRSLRTRLGEYAYNRILNDYLDDYEKETGIQDLASALAKERYDESISTLQKLFSEVPKQTIIQACEGSSEATKEMVTQKILKAIRTELEKCQKLDAGLQRIGLGPEKSEEEKEKEMTGRCLWVPASIRHRQGENYRVYGGVLLNPDITVLEEKDPNRQHLIDNVFHRDTQVRTDVSYLVDIQRAASQIQSNQFGDANVENPMFDFMLADAIQKAQERIKAEAEAKAKVETQTGTTRTGQKGDGKEDTEGDSTRSSGGSGAYPSTSTTHPSSATTETCRTASLEAEVQTTTKVEVGSQVETKTDTTNHVGNKEGKASDDTEGDSTRSSGGSALYPSIGISAPVPLSSGYSTYGMFGECSSSSSAGSYHSPNTPYASMGPSFSSDTTRQGEEELVTKVMQESKAEYDQQQRGYYEAYGHSTSATETQYASSIPPEEKQTFELGRVEVITEQEERTLAVRQEVEARSSANAGGDDGSRGNEVEAASAGGGDQSGGGNGGGSGGGSGGGNGGGGDRPPSRPSTPPKDDPGDKKEKKEDNGSKEAKATPSEASTQSSSNADSGSDQDQNPNGGRSSPRFFQKAEDHNQAQSTISALQLRQQLLEEEVNAMFKPNGELTQEAIDNSHDLKLKLKNPALLKVLSERSGNLADWSKYETAPVRTKHGPAKLHFYYNPVTKDAYFGMDYKAVYNHKGKWNLVLPEASFTTYEEAMAMKETENESKMPKNNQ